MENEDLMHYGVPGMKWGVRRAKKAGRRVSDRVVSTKLAKERFKDRHNAYKLSDTELKQKIDRLNLENNYATATARSWEINKSIGRKAIAKYSQSTEGKALLKMGAKSATMKTAAATGNQSLVALAAAATAGPVTNKKK